MSVSAEKQTNLSGHKWHVCQLEFSPSGLHLASASWDKTVRIWDLSTLESMFVLRHHRNPVTCLSWQPQGAAEGHLGRLASGSADGTVALWSGETGKLLQSISHHKGWVLGTSFSSGGDLLASAGWDKTVCLSDVRTGRLIHRLVGHTTGVWNCAFQTSGISTNLLCSGADDGSLKIWDTRMANSVMSLVGAHDDSVKSCAWSPDGGYIASGAADNKHPQMIIPGSLKDRLSQGLARVDGRSLDQEHIALWEPRSGTLLIKLRAHEDAVNEIQFYPVISSKSVPIIFSVGDNSCRVWHPLRKRSKQLQIIKQHRLGLEVEALALSPDGTLLATGARDKDIVLSSLDVSLTEVDALPIEDQSEAAINKGATLWKKYTKKVMQKIMSETSDSDSSQSPRNTKNTASLVGRAVYKTEQKPKVNGIFKDSQHTVAEVNGEKSRDGVIKDHRARLRKSSRLQDSTEAPVKSTNGLDDTQSEGIIMDHRARLRKTSRPDGIEEPSKATNGWENHTQSNGILKHPKGILRKSSRPDSTGSEDNSTNEFDLVRQRLRHVELQNGHDDVDINGNGYSIFDENGLYPKRSGYHSHNDSSSVSSSSYYGDIEDVAKEMNDLANGVADSRL